MGRRVKSAAQELVREALALAMIERRDELGLSQLQVANRAGLSQSRISNFEAADQGCSVLQLWLIAQALELDATELTRRTEVAYKLLSDPDHRRLFWTGRARVRGTRLRQ